MSLFQLAGYAACALVFAAFYMRGMVMVRVVALCANVAFVVYALGLHLPPIAVLHLALIPVNGWRLWEILRPGPVPATAAAKHA